MEPSHIYRVFPDGRGGRDYRFRESRFQDYLDDPKTGTIGFRGAAGLDFELWSRLELRESPVGPGFGAPLWHALLIQLGEEAIDEQDAITVAQGFLTKVVEEVPILHGGITVFERLVEAEAEITFVGENMDEQPKAFYDRWDHDGFSTAELWDKLRRLYWNTYIGSKFISVMGGVAGAEKAGALVIDFF